MWRMMWMSLIVATSSICQAAEAKPKPINLLQFVKPEVAIVGTWALQGGELVSEAKPSARIEIPYTLPEEYDLHVEWTREKGPDWDVHVMSSYQGKSFTFAMSAYADRLAGLADFNNLGMPESPMCKPFPTRNKKRYVVDVKVRNDVITGSINGTLISKCTEPEKLRIIDAWKLKSTDVVGLGANNSVTRFHSVLLTEVSGKGQPKDPPEKK